MSKRRRNRTKDSTDYSLKGTVRRMHKMDKEELRNYYEITRKSARVTRDKSKFNKKDSRREGKRISSNY